MCPGRKDRIFEDFQLPFHETLLGASPTLDSLANLNTMGLRTSLWVSFFLWTSDLGVKGLDFGQLYLIAPRRPPGQDV